MLGGASDPEKAKGYHAQKGYQDQSAKKKDGFSSPITKMAPKKPKLKFQGKKMFAFFLLCVWCIANLKIAIRSAFFV